MRTIAIYNNKGGVGKSTVTTLLADFFSSVRVARTGALARVLVMDLDAQSSAARALIGEDKLEAQQSRDGSAPDLLAKLAGRRHASLDDYLIERAVAELAGRQTALGQLWVMVSDRAGTMGLESNRRIDINRVFSDLLKPMLADRFDLAIIDLPGNIDARNRLPMAALCCADFIIVPTATNQIETAALEYSFQTIRDAQGIARQAGLRAPKIAGVLLNRVDRRTKQYRLHADEVGVLAASNKSLVFDAWLPPAVPLASATDDSIGFEAIKERYDSYWPHVRKVAMETAQRCGIAKVTKAN